MQTEQQDVDDWVVNLKQGIQGTRETRHTKQSNKEFDEIMEAILARPSTNRVMQTKIRKFIQQLTAQMGKKPDESEIFNRVLQYFGKLLKSQQGIFVLRK